MSKKSGQGFIAEHVAIIVQRINVRTYEQDGEKSASREYKV